MPSCGSEPGNRKMYRELLVIRSQNPAASLQPRESQAQVQPMMMELILENQRKLSNANILFTLDDFIIHYFENAVLKSLILKKQYRERWLRRVRCISATGPVPICVPALEVIFHANCPCCKSPLLHHLYFSVVKQQPRPLAKSIPFSCSVGLARLIFAFLSNSLIFAFWSMSSRCWV
jgi:hypothetical protein